MRVSNLLLLVVAGAAACVSTSFHGDAHYRGGVPACQDNCARQHMEMAAFIYSGEFATSCVCRPRAQDASAGKQSSLLERAIFDLATVVAVAVRQGEESNRDQEVFDTVGTIIELIPPWTD